MDAPEPILAGLYQAHARELHGFARRRVGRQEAEDVVQDAYLHLLQRGAIAGLEHPRAYLFRIAANLAVDAARKSKTRTRYAEDEIEFLGLATTAASPEATVEGAMELRRFRASLDELPALCREAFLLSRIDELTHAEIAKRLGVSVRTVDRHMAKALNHLRLRLHRLAQSPSAASLRRMKASIGQRAESDRRQPSRLGARPDEKAKLAGLEARLEVTA